MKTICCVYKIVSEINNKFYIGSALDYIRRKKRHLSDLQNNKHHSILLQRHYNKYGINDLSIEIIETVPNGNSLLIREQHYIDTLKPIFNINPTAGSNLGRKFLNSKPHPPCSDITKKRMSEAKIGSKHPKFKGFYITPFGKFASSYQAEKFTGECGRSVQRWCKKGINGYSFEKL